MCVFIKVDRFGCILAAILYHHSESKYSKLFWTVIRNGLSHNMSSFVHSSSKGNSLFVKEKTWGTLLTNRTVYRPITNGSDTSTTLTTLDRWLLIKLLAHDMKHYILLHHFLFSPICQALMSLFVLASKDGWVDIMYDGLDAVGVDQQVTLSHNGPHLSTVCTAKNCAQSHFQARHGIYESGCERTSCSNLMSGLTLCMQVRASVDSWCSTKFKTYKNNAETYLRSWRTGSRLFLTD